MNNYASKGGLIRLAKRISASTRQSLFPSNLGALFVLTLVHDLAGAKEQDLSGAAPSQALEQALGDSQTLQTAVEIIRDTYPDISDRLFSSSPQETDLAAFDSDAVRLAINEMQASGYLSAEEAARLLSALRELDAAREPLSESNANQAGSGGYQDVIAQATTTAKEAASGIEQSAGNIASGLAELSPVTLGVLAGVGAFALSRAKTKDTTAPVAPSLALATDSGASSTDGLTNVGTVNVSGIESGATWQYSVDGGKTWTAGTGTSFTLPAGSYASGAVQVKQTDVAGNASTAGSNAGAIVVDVSAAAPSLALATDSGASSTDGLTNVGTVNVSGIESGATWQYSVDGGKTWTAGTGTSFTLPAGSYASGAVQVKQTDVAGNASTAGSNAGAITVDTTAPLAKSVAVTGGTNTISITYDTDLDAVNKPVPTDFVVTVNGTSNVVTAVSVSGKTVTLTLTSPVTTGSNVQVKYTDPGAGDSPKAIQDLAGNDAATVTTGKVADGYVRGAQIYIDSNGNGKPDANEKLEGVVTDAKGNFFLPTGPNTPQGSVIAVGGVNIDTGVPNNMILKAPAGATMVSPLTTIVQTYLEKNPTQTLAAAKTAVAAALNIPTTVDLTTFDPIAASEDPASAAVALVVQKVNAQIAVLVEEAHSAPAEGTSAGDAALAVISNLTTVVQTASTSSTTVNLTDSATLTTVLGTTTTATATTVSTTITAISTATTLAAVSTQQAIATDTIAPAKATVALVSAPPVLTFTGADKATSATVSVSLDTVAIDGSAATAGNIIKIFDGSGTTPVASVTLTQADIDKGFVQVNVAGLALGTRSLSVTVTDLAGLSSARSDGVTVTIDKVLAVASADEAAVFTNLTDAITGSAYTQTYQTINLADGGVSLTDAQASALVGAGLSFSVDDTAVGLSYGGQGTELKTSLSDMQKLGVDTVSITGARVSIGIGADDPIQDGAGVLPVISSEGVVVLTGVLGSELQQNTVAQLKAGAALLANAGFDELNLSDNGISLTVDQASALVSSGLSFADNDTGVEVDVDSTGVVVTGQGTELKTSLTDLQKLGVDAINVNLTAGLMSMSIGAGELDLDALPQIDAATGVQVGLLVDDADLAGSSDLGADAQALSAAGFDVLNLADDTFDLSEAQASALVAAGLSFADNDTGVVLTAEGTQLQTSLSDMQKLGVDFVADGDPNAPSHLTVSLGDGLAAGVGLPVFDDIDDVTLRIDDDQVAGVLEWIDQDTSNADINNIDQLAFVLRDVLGIKLGGDGVLDARFSDDIKQIVVSDETGSNVTLANILDSADGAVNSLNLGGASLVSALNAAVSGGILIEGNTKFTVSDADVKALMDAGLLSATGSADVTVTDVDGNLAVTLAQLSAIGADGVTGSSTTLDLDLGLSQTLANKSALETAIANLLERFDDGAGSIKPIFEAADTVNLHVSGSVSGQVLDTALFAQLKLLGIDDVLGDDDVSLKPPGG